MKRMIITAAVALALFSGTAAVATTVTAPAPTSTATEAVKAPETAANEADAWATFNSMSIPKNYGPELVVQYVSTSDKVEAAIDSTSFILESKTHPGTYHTFHYASVKNV